jgi:hypothetical protein
MLDLALNKRSRHDADYCAARVKRCIGKRSHESDPTASVNEINLAMSESSPHFLRGPHVEFIGPATRTTKDTDVHARR